MENDRLSRWLGELPKAELHLHLEGAIPHVALWELMEKYGGDPSVPTREALERRFVFRDFAEFIDAWVWKNSFIREYVDFAFVAEAVASDLLRQNILYAEVFYSPGDYARIGLEPGGITEAIRAGLDRVSGVEVALVVDLIRDHGPERGDRVLRSICEVRDLGVVGVGIGGSEAGFPPEPYRRIYAEARRLGFFTSAHAGEAAGPASVRGAIEHLEVDRIGHATRAEEDPAVLELLASRVIPLEICLLSNVKTGVVPSVAAHPVRRYYELGIPLSINTDDPGMFGNSLVNEYRALMSVHGFTPEEVIGLIEQALVSSWLPPGGKEDTLRRFRAGFLSAGKPR
jgi:adenosine deaminase